MDLKPAANEARRLQANQRVSRKRFWKWRDTLSQEFLEGYTPVKLMKKQRTKWHRIQETGIKQRMTKGKSPNSNSAEVLENEFRLGRSAEDSMGERKSTTGIWQV